MAAASLTLEIRQGPALRAALDVLDLADDLLELVPEWEAEQRAELARRAETLAELMIQELQARPG